MAPRTCWIDLLVDQQLKQGLGDVKPEPNGFPLPRKVLEVGSINDTPVSEQVQEQITAMFSLPLPYLVEPVYCGLDLDAYPGT